MQVKSIIKRAKTYVCGKMLCKLQFVQKSTLLKIDSLEFMSIITQKGMVIKLENSIVVQKILREEFDELIEAKVQPGMEKSKFL